MRKRTLGATGLEVSELALGTWGLSGDGYGPVEESERDAVIERAVALGVTLFETSDTYAGGEMEKRLGELLPKDDTTFVATRVGTDTSTSPPRKKFDAATIKAAAERSRERLARERIDILLLHNPAPTTLARAELGPAMNELCSSGVARTWGVSAGTPEAAAEALKAGAPVLELAYNVFHRRELDHVVEQVKEKNVGVLARSVLSYGLLCGQWPTGKSFERGDHRKERWSEAELKRRIVQLNALRPSVTTEVTSLRAVALRYVLSHPQVTSAVLGPRRTAQLDQLLRDAGKDPYLPEGGRTALENRTRTAGVQP
ncbi:MAG TPA: aldo/keto reductase [Polyangiaceae bacterium]|nr:aldo/keto reductase [Polyangiaceae bacterium]